MEYKVVEKFVSINGEGTHSGQLAVFIRFCGCNLDCSFCDTKWANEAAVKYDLMDENQIADYITAEGIHNVTLTGGEPLLQPGIEILIEKLTRQGLYVELETNGSVDLLKFSKIIPRPSFTMDYKLPVSGMENFMRKENFNVLDKNDTIKFVAGSHEDLERMLKVIRENKLFDKCNVYVSPVFGKIDPADIVEFMKEHRLNGLNMQLQMHKFIWAPDAKGV